MAETIQEIVALIENLKTENKNSNEDFIKILNDISAKLNNIQNDNGEIDVVISSIKQTLDSKIQLDNNKIEELGTVLNNLKVAIYSATDYSELVEQVTTLSDNFKSGFNSVVSFANKDADAKNILMDRIQSLEDAVKNGVMIESLKQRTDELVKGYENFISDSNLRHGNMVSAIVDLKNKIDDYSSKNNYTLATIEHSMNDTNSKILNLESTVSANLGNVNSKLYSMGDDLQKILNDSFDHLKYLSSNMSEAMNSNSLDFKTTIEVLKANVASFSDNLNDEFGKINENIVNKIEETHSADIVLNKEMLERVNELEKTLLSKADEYEVGISEKYHELSNFIDALKETVTISKSENNAYLSDKLSEFRAEIGEVSQNFEKLMVDSSEEIRNISKAINQNSDEIINYFQEKGASEIATLKNDLLVASGNNFSGIVEKIQGINDNIEDFKNSAADNLSNYLKTLKEMFVDFSGNINITAENEEILDKLNNLEVIMSRFDIEKNDNFNHLQVLIENNKVAIEDLKNSNVSGNNLERLETIIEEHSRNKDEKLDNLNSSVNNCKEVFEQLTSELSIQSENTLNELSDLKTATKEILNRTQNNEQDSIERLSAELRSQLEHTANELSELKTLSVDMLHKKPDYENLSDLLSGKIGDCKDKIADEASEIKTSIKAISDGLVELSPIIEIGEISSKLSNMEQQFNEAFENYDLSLSVLNVRLNEYTESLANSKGFSTSDMTNYEAEFDEIRLQIAEMSDKMTNLVGNSGLIEILANIRKQFNVVEALVKSEKEASVADIRTTLDEVVSVINNNLYLIGQNIEAIYAKQSENSENIIDSLNTNLDAIRGNINSLIADIDESLETKMLALLRDFEPLKEAITNYTETDFSKIVAEVKEAVELSYVNIVNEIKSEINNSVNIDEIEEKYKNSVNRLDEFEDVIHESIKSNIDVINNTLLNIHNTTLNSADILEDIQSGFQTDLMLLEGKVKDFADATQETVTSGLEEIKEYISKYSGVNPEDIKNAILPFFDNEELLTTVRTVNKTLADKITELQQDEELANQQISEVVNSIKDAVDNSIALINEKFENSGNNAKTIIENIEKINEKFDVLVMASNDDTVKNAVSDINDRITDTLENIKTVSNIITGMDVKSTTDLEYLINVLEDIMDTTADFGKYSGLLEELNNKVDAIVSNENKIINENLEKTFGNINNLKHDINEILSFEVILREIALKLDIIATEDINEELLNNVDTIKNVVLEYRNKFVKTDENISNLTNLVQVLDSKLDIVAQADNEEVLSDIADVKDSLKSVSDKVDIIAQADNEEVLSDIAEVKDSLQSVLDKVDIIAQADNEEVLSDIAEVKDSLQSVLDKVDIIAQAGNEEVLSDIAEVKDSLKSVSDKIDIIAQADNEDVLSDIAQIREHFGRVEYKIDCLSQLSYDQLKPETDSIKSDLSNIKDSINALQNRIDVIVQTSDDEEVFQEISSLKNLISSIGSKIDILAQASNNEDILIDGIEQIQENLNKLTQKVDTELNLNDGLFGTDISDIKYNMKEIYSKIDNINSDATNELASKVDELSSNLDSAKNSISDAISKQDFVDKESFKNKLDELKNQLISTESNLEEYSRTLDYKLDEISQFNDVNNRLDDIKSSISDGSICLKDLVKELNTKVDILAMSDDSAVIDEISVIREVVEAQIDALRQSSEKESNQNSNELKTMMSELEKIDETIKSIDLTKSTAEIKNTVISAFESITFGKETEKIKDFVGERTDEIQHILLQVKHQLAALSSSGDDMDLYTYTMQDVESDLAKLRLVVNEMSNKVGDNEISVVSTNLNKMTRSMEDLQRVIVASGLDKTTSANLAQEVLSISSRLNQLILAHQGFDKDEQLRNSLAIRNLQKTIKEIDTKLEYSTNVVTIIKDVMIYLGEWMDGTTDTLSSIYDKCDITDIIEDLKNVVQNSVNLSNSGIEKLQDVLSSRLESIENIYEKRIAKQEARLDRIEKQLDKICNIIDTSNNDTVTNSRIDEIDEKLIRLSNNIEKLTAYVE